MNALILMTAPLFSPNPDSLHFKPVSGLPPGHPYVWTVALS
jgi:hypothetical protein